MAIASPLLDVSIAGATGVLFTITGGIYTLVEVNEAAQIISEAVDPEANIIFGAVIDEALRDEVQITVIATGFRPRSTRTAPTPVEHAAPAPRHQGREQSADHLDVPAFLRDPR